MKNKRKFGELETFILQKIKKQKKATVKDIHEFIKNSTSYTTVMTVMMRLFKKGILQREKIGQSYIYYLNDSNYFSKLLNNIKNRVFSGNSVEMISCLLESEEISKKDLKEINKLIEKMRKTK